MKKKMLGSAIVFMAILFISPFVFADAIKLKNGKLVEGTIVEKNGQSVKVDLSGILLTYYLDEIESVNGEKVKKAEIKNESGKVISKSEVQKSIPGTDQWNRFLKFTEQFYYLDKQNFNNISCDISTAFINNLLSTVETQLKSFENNLTVENSIDTFRLKFNKEKGLTFNLPKFDIEIISEQGMTDPVRVKSGISTMKNGFDNAVKGATDMIRGIFESYISPKRNEYEIIEISESEKGTKLIYKHKGYTVTDLYSGTHCESTQTNGMVTIHATEEYKKVDGKLLLDKGSVTMDQGVQSMSSDITVEYQQIGSIYFPSKIKNDTKISMGDIKSEIPIEVIFKNTKVD
ncbi:MAG: hypothetical protein WCI77_07450 [Candidatus Omnitrophota bacterium]